MKKLLCIKGKQNILIIFQMVAILSVSGQIDSSCTNIIKSMTKLNLCGDVTPNKSIYNQVVENGCRVILVSKTEKKDVEKLWNHIKDTHNFTCAHVEFKNYTSGCVFDVFSPSKCPSQV